ncbi:FtsB family cell division protein [Hornefia butyriciproducens]|uniref:FtsB family cell division protein n=1 Tax=Hornefia butyriciproducens TaxID=2652293 RepID=UPI003D0519A4
MERKTRRNTGRRKKRVRINKTRMALTVVILIVGIIFALSVKNIVDLRIEQKNLKKENVELKAEKKKLEAELKNVNDKNYIEEQARTQLNMIKPGEILYITGDDDNRGKSNEK